MDAFTIVMVTLVVLFLSYIHSYLSECWSYWKNRGVPSAPVWSINVLFLKTFLGRVHIGDPLIEVYRELEGEPLGGFYRFLKPMLMARDPEVIKLVLLKEFPSFHDNEIQVSDDGDHADPVLSRNPFAATGEKWKIVRSQLSPAFTTSKIRTIFPLMLEVCEDLKSYLEVEKPQDGFDVKDLAARFTTDVVTSCTMGLKSNAIKDPKSIFRKMGSEIFKPSFLMNLKFIIVSFLPKLGRILRLRIVNQEVYNFFYEIVKTVTTERLQNGTTRNDFLQLLVNLKDKGRVSEEDEKVKANIGKRIAIYAMFGKETSDQQKCVVMGDPYTLDDIVAHVVGFFLDGSETSSIVLGYALLEIGLNPHVQETLREEIESAIQENGGVVDFDCVSKMKFLDMVLLESLRKYPVANSFTKVCTKPCELPTKIGSVKVDVGTLIIIPFYSLHRDPKWYPDPEKFDPERFNEENRQKRHRFSYLSFGEGPRMCIGFRFGQAQIKAAIVTLVRHFDISVGNKTKIPITFDKNNFMYTPEGGAWLHFHRRTTEYK